MDNLGAMTTVMLLVMIAAVPYVWRIHHSSQKFLAAYLIFAVIFLTAFFALFNGALYLLTSLGRGDLLEQTVALFFLLVVTLLPSFALATWQARKPHVTRKPP